MNRRGRENCSRGADGAPDVRAALQRDSAAAYAHRQVRPSPAPRTPEPGLPAPPWPGLVPPHSWDTCAGHTGSHGGRLTPVPNTEVQGAGVTPALHSCPLFSSHSSLSEHPRRL